MVPSHVADDPEVQGNPAKPPARSAAVVVLGVALMAVGAATMVGGAVLHFAVKAGRVDLFPYAGRLVILAGLGAAIVGVALAGSRAAVTLGAAMLAAGLGMLAFGYANFAEPSLRLYAPLGFFVGLAGGCLVWGGRTYDEEARKLAAGTAADSRPKAD